MHMVPAIRNILGGFLFAGDDVYKKAGVLSGGERTRLAVARMLLRPSNTLVLDEPTNHLDLDSKDVLLDALEDYGGTLLFVSHDRYFVERLATKVVEVGQGPGRAGIPGTYAEFLWRKAQGARPPPPTPATPAMTATPVAEEAPPPPPVVGKSARARAAEARCRRAEEGASAPTRRWRGGIADLEGRIAERESGVKAAEAAMGAPGFYDDRERRQGHAGPPPGADVGGRRAARAVGDAAGRGRGDEGGAFGLRDSRHPRLARIVRLSGHSSPRFRHRDVRNRRIRQPWWRQNYTVWHGSRTSDSSLT